MRRLVLTCALVLGLAVPAAALAVQRGSGDGWLVVKNGDNGDGIGKRARPLATIVVNGFVIGSFGEQGKIAIYDLDASDQNAPEVSGSTGHADAPQLTMADGTTVDGTIWTGGAGGMRFRAVDGTYRVQVYGSGVYLFAGGQGNVTFAGSDDAPRSDGTYSLNGNAFRSIPLDAQVKIVAPAGS